MRMETIKPVATLTTELQARESEDRTTHGTATQPALRALTDYELWFVGGGEDTPHW